MIKLTQFISVVLGVALLVQGNSFKKIVGGNDINIKDIPYQVQIEYNDSQVCGGSIISTNYILTAAHCLDGNSTDNIKVRSGTTYVSRDGIITKVVEAHQHPNYDDSTLDYDVGIYKLEVSLIFNDVTQPIKLSTQTPQVNEKMMVAGWGSIADGTRPDHLQAITVPVINQAECVKAYVDVQPPVTDNMFCAGVEGKDACIGDNGGGAVANGILKGVVAWNHGCGLIEYPGVYTKVAPLREFIDEVTKGETNWVD